MDNATSVLLVICFALGGIWVLLWNILGKLREILYEIRKAKIRNY